MTFDAREALDDLSTTELDALLADQPIAPPSLTGAKGKKCGRHPGWKVDEYQDDPQSRVLSARLVCVRCGAVKDEARSRRGRNARSRGNALERWVNGLLGISNRGKYGGPEDGGGEADWISVQTKSGTYFPLVIDRWLRAVPQRAGQMRGVVLVETPGPGQKRRALLVVDLYEAADMWGGRTDEVAP